MEPLSVTGIAIGLITLVQSTIQLVNGSRFLVRRDHVASSDERFRLDVEILLDDAQVDIVFIHNLNGSGGEREVKFSPRDVSRLFSANILNYGYDTTLRSSEFLLGRTLRHEGIQLIRRLVHLRSNRLIGKRPIIFVAHSLGGILLKNALVLSQMSTSKDEEEICRSTMGIIFLNTPQERVPNSFAASIWNIVHPNPHPKNLRDPKWQKDDFYMSARSLAYHTNCFEPIARDLITPPIYLNINTADAGRSGLDTSHKLLFGGLWSIMEHLNSPEYRSDHVSSRVNAKVVVLSKVSRDSSVVTNLPGMDLCTKQGTCPCGLCPFKSNLEGCGDILQLQHAPGQLALHLALKSDEEILSSPSKSPYRSIFMIKATNRASIGLSCLDIYRRILLHYSSQIGPKKAEELLGIRGIDETTDSKILSQPETLASIMEAVAHWLIKPQNNRWILVIEDMPIEEKCLTQNVARKDKPKDATSMILLNAMLMLRQSSDRDCHVIYTSSNQNTEDGFTASQGEPTCSFSSLCSRPGLDGMDDVVQRILRLCITLSDESTRGITTEVIHQCDDLIANTAEPAVARSKTEDAFQYLKASGILELFNTHNSRIEFLRVHKSIKRHRLSPGLPNRDEIALAWTCLEKTVKWISQQKGLIEQWDLGSSLVESCSAVVRWCYEIQESLDSLEVNSMLLGELCERHSAYSTATILYESAYSQRRPKLCQYGLDSFSFDVEATHKLARIYFLSGVMDKAKQKNDETIKLIRESHRASKVLFVDTFRLDAALNAAKGNMEIATNKLEKLLEDLGGYDRDSDARGESIDDNAAFLSVVRDLVNYLVHSGDYKRASLLLQRALLSQKRHPSQNQPILLALHEAMAILNRRQGELRDAERHYLEARDILDLWVGDCHPCVALNLASCAVTIGLQGRNEEATELFRTALSKARYYLGIQHHEVCHIQELLVLCLAAGGHYESAITELLELEQNLNTIPGDSIRRPITRVRQYKKSLEIARIGRGVCCHKDGWLKELELVEDDVSGNRQRIFLERQNELLSSFFFHFF